MASIVEQLNTINYTRDDFYRIKNEYTFECSDTLKNKLAQVSRLGLSRIWSVRANDVFKVGIEQLKLDPFFFLFSHPQSEPWKL